MGTLLLLAAGGYIVWLIVQSAGKRRLLVEAQRRRALAVFQIDRGDKTHSDWTLFDFESMTAQERIDGFEPGTDRKTAYSLRRRDGGWEWKMTRDSWTERIKWLQKMKADPLMDLPMNVDDKARLEAEIKMYADGPIWVALSDEFAAPIETAYQRYVRQG
jgi:hypothetical protein